MPCISHGPNHSCPGMFIHEHKDVGPRKQLDPIAPHGTNAAVLVYRAGNSIEDILPPI